VVPFLLCTGELPAAQLADMVQVRLAAGKGLLPSQDPIYGLKDLLLRWGCKGRHDRRASESQTEAHLVLEAMLAPES